MKNKLSALQYSLKLLNFRWRTIAELKAKLQEKQYPDLEINETIELLKQNQLLDDERFAKAYIRQKNLLKPTGRYRLTQELIKHQVNRDLINKALSETPEESPPEIELAKDALSSKLRQYRRLENNTFRRRALSFLQRRGFSYPIAKKALAELEKDR